MIADNPENENHFVRPASRDGAAGHPKTGFSLSTLASL